MHPAPPSLADVVQAFVSNTPALVYQFVRRDDASLAFPYLNECCQALLGLSPAQLQAEPQRLLALIVEDDRQSYLDAMDASAASLSNWNWEGRLAIPGWDDLKWINLRATPRKIDGGVQWDGIMTNISASRHERERMAELTAHIEAVKEEERSRIAREIHDDLGGNLTAIKMALAMLVKRLPDDPALQSKAAYVDALVDRSIDSVHRISLDLRPSMLELGIVPALDWQAREFEKQNGIPCAFKANEAEIALPPEQAIALFRIFQEALTNIAKHAKATRVEVSLERAPGTLHLSIADNGAGLSSADRRKPQSFGLRGMQERAEALKGSLSLSAAPGGGTIVAVHIAHRQ